MDKEFIKWLCDKAEGFDYGVNHRNHEYIFCPDVEKLWVDDIHEALSWIDVYYPLLLQKAIEGVNAKHFTMGGGRYPWIITASRHLEIIVQIDSGYWGDDLDGVEHKKCYNYSCKITIDQAKEEALKWVIQNGG